MEFFAGEANVWRAVASAYAAARVDIEYGSRMFEEETFKPQPRKQMFQNPLDILSDPGLATLSSSFTQETHRQYAVRI